MGTQHQDYRHRRGIGGKLDFDLDASTSNIPFVALLSGKQVTAPCFAYKCLYDDTEREKKLTGIIVNVSDM